MAERDWRMLAPCAQCPFVNKDVANTLRPGRLSEIKDALRRDTHFVCHKTTRGTGDGSNRQCAGAIAWQEQRGLYPNQMARVCMRLDATGMGKKRAAIEQVMREEIPDEPRSGTGVFRCSKCHRSMIARPIRETSGVGGACKCGGLIEMVPESELPTKRVPWAPITDGDVIR
jgi:hypothetical protein